MESKQAYILEYLDSKNNWVGKNEIPDNKLDPFEKGFGDGSFHKTILILKTKKWIERDNRDFYRITEIGREVLNNYLQIKDKEKVDKEIERSKLHNEAGLARYMFSDYEETKTRSKYAIWISIAALLISILQFIFSCQ